MEEAEAASEADEVAKVVAEVRAALAASAFSVPKVSAQRVKSATAAAAEEADEATMEEMEPYSGCAGGGESPELVGAAAMVGVVVRVSASDESNGPNSTRNKENGWQKKYASWLCIRTPK